MSLGSRSGVAWIRVNSPPIERAKARANVVLPTPGTPSNNRLPSANRQTAAVRDGFGIAGDDALDVVDQPTERVRRLTHARTWARSRWKLRRPRSACLSSGYGSLRARSEYIKRDRAPSGPAGTRSGSSSSFDEEGGGPVQHTLLVEELDPQPVRGERGHDLAERVVPAVLDLGVDVGRRGPRRNLRPGTTASRRPSSRSRAGGRWVRSGRRRSPTSPDGPRGCRRCRRASRSPATDRAHGSRSGSQPSAPRPV